MDHCWRIRIQLKNYPVRFTATLSKARRRSLPMVIDGKAAINIRLAPQVHVSNLNPVVPQFSAYLQSSTSV